MSSIKNIKAKKESIVREENGGVTIIPAQLILENGNLKWGIGDELKGKFKCWEAWFPMTAKLVGEEVSNKVSGLVTAYLLAETLQSIPSLEKHFEHSPDSLHLEFNKYWHHAIMDVNIKGDKLTMKIGYNGCDTRVYEASLFDAALRHDVIYYDVDINN